MATFRVDGDIPVTLPDGLSQGALLAFPPFQVNGLAPWEGREEPKKESRLTG